MNRLGTGLRCPAVIALATLLAAAGAYADIVVITGIAGGALWLIS